MPNDEIPPNQPNGVDPRRLAARMRSLELRVSALEEAQIRRAAAAEKMLREMAARETQPLADRLLSNAEATSKALAQLERKQKKHKLRRRP
jgi:hypothetical protein